MSPDYGAKPMGNDRGTPGNQERVRTDEERHEKALEDTFRASDPIPLSRIDGPNN